MTTPTPTLLTVTPRRSAAECEARLEASPLYQRRQYEFRQTANRAFLEALWFLDPRMVEQYLDMVKTETR